MTLKKACEFAEACGLRTIQEAIANIDRHATQLFSCSTINKELHELYVEARKYPPRMEIKDFLKK